MTPDLTRVAPQGGRSDSCSRKIVPSRASQAPWIGITRTLSGFAGLVASAGILVAGDCE